MSTRSHNGAALSYYFYIRAVKKMYCFFLFRVVSWRDDVTHVSITWEMFFVYYSKARSDVFLMRQNEQGNVIVRDRETTLNCLISFIWIWCFPSIVQNRAPTLLSFYTLHVSKSTLLPHASTDIWTLSWIHELHHGTLNFSLTDFSHGDLNFSTKIWTFLRELEHFHGNLNFSAEI